MATMLDVAKDGALKTRIMNGAKLSLGQLNSFIEFLKENGLMEEVAQRDAGKFYTTPKGLLFLERFRTINELFISGDSSEETDYPI